MKLILYLSVLFMLYELLKVIMPGTYWRTACLKKAILPLRILDWLYFIFLIVLFFTPYWYAGLAVIIVSIITAIQMSPYVDKKIEFNKIIKTHLVADNMASILILLIIIFNEIKL